MKNLDNLIIELCKVPIETGWIEFKQNKVDSRMIGKDISAMANSALLAEHDHAYLIWGVEDNTHEITGTNISLKESKVGNEELENWLRCLLSKNADFTFESTDINGHHVELIIINKAIGFPVSFEKVEYIRSGSYTKKLLDIPTLQAQLWDRLRHGQFEGANIKTNLHLKDVFNLLNFDNYFLLLNIPIPESRDNYVHYMVEEDIISRQDNGLFAITALGALLFARKLSDFSRVGRKAIRIVQYEGNNRLSILKEESFDEGYATSFEKAVKYVSTILPSKENVKSIQRETISIFPALVIREAIANSLIHQDFYITGAGPIIEIFSNRVEVTNPGSPLVDVMRIIDNPPKSRNEKLASLMRRMGMCEELGRGWDRMVIACESQCLPAPRINVYEESTKVSLFSFIDFTYLSPEDKTWSAYLHSCIKYIEGSALTNKSLRERFGLKETSAGSISRLIKDVVRKKLIKPLDPTTAKRYMKYIPIWG